MSGPDVRVRHSRGETPIEFASSIASAAGRVAALDRVGLIAVDERVWELHGEQLAAIGPSTALVPVPAGEAAKSLVVAESLWHACLARGLDRRSRIVAVGGGATTDAVGFAAATWMRGVSWIAVPTTLLGMVDAAIGGKTGLDVRGAKNMVGAFHHPERVIIAPGVLSTLSPREFASGMAEVVKSGIIGDVSLIERLESGPPLTAEDPRLHDVIRDAVRVKASVVANDERESGRRAILNFGHTIGHAVESAGGLDRWRHGEAVAIGMCVAAELSHHAVGLSESEVGRIRRLLLDAGLPVADPGLDPRAVEPWLLHDKKSLGGSPRFVLTPRLGSASFGHEIPQPLLRQILARFFGESSLGSSA